MRAVAADSASTSGGIYSPQVGPPIVIVGAGPVGIRVLRELRSRDPELAIVIYGDERHQPYNRVQLSGLLAGQFKVPELALAAELLNDSCPLTRFLSRQVESIDPRHRTVTDCRGERQAFSKLVLATGSSPFVPAIPGVNLPGVYTFRDMADAEKLAARRVQSKHTLVLGAGLLGIEAARAMQRHNTRVTLVDHNAHPMFRQLDAAAGSILAGELERRGIRLLLGTRVRMVLGTTGVQGVVLGDGSEVECDTVVVATGIRPRKDIALQAGIAVGRGITVNPQMQTSDPDIYAIGECCEFDGQVYGIVAPGFEQAAIAAGNIVGREAPGSYRGTVLATSLKVADLPVFSMGDVDPPVSVRSLVWRRGNDYRRLSLVAGRITGINAVGAWGQLSALRDFSKRRKRVWPWQLWRFRTTGELLPPAASGNVAAWPSEAIVCNCNSVSRGELTAVIGAGAQTLEALGGRTRAGGSCGSCLPLLRELLGDTSPRQPLRKGLPLQLVSGLAFCAALAALILSVPYPDTVQLERRWDLLWRDEFNKQVSGYTILGLTAISLLFSFRKRIAALSFGDFVWWRLLHIALATLALAAVAVHTGFRLGDSLNLVLMFTFLALAVVGALTGFTLAWEHRLQPVHARRLRSFSLWSHILLSWPLPALLGLHVLKSYYF